MEFVSMLLGVTNTICAIVFIAICILPLLGKIKPNHVYGFRIKKAFTSDANWYRINRYGALWMILWSVVLLAIGIACFFIPYPVGCARRVLWLALLHAPLITGIPCLQTWLYARKL